MADQHAITTQASQPLTSNGPAPEQLSAADQERRNKSLDFLLDKTYANWIECSKAMGISILTYFLLMIVSIVLIFGKGVGVADNVTIPLVQLTVDKYFAALFSLGLSSLALHWVFACSAADQWLIMRFNALYTERFGDVGHSYSRWQIEYPTSFSLTTTIFSASGKTDSALLGFVICLMIFALLSPPVIAYFLGLFAGYNPVVRIIVCVASLVLTIPALAGAVILSGDAKTTEGQLARLDAGPNSE